VSERSERTAGRATAREPDGDGVRGRGPREETSERGERGQRDPVPLGAHLDSLLRTLRGPARHALGGVFGGWERVVGPALAAHVRPVRLDHGTLTVEVDEPAWATQVSFLSDELRAKLNAEPGVVVERIDVRVARARRRSDPS